MLALYFLSAFVLSRLTVDEEAAAPDELAVYILTNGIHSDIVVPSNTDQMNWFTQINHLDTSLNQQYNYVSIGWGDKGFYLNTPTWAELKASTALNAAFGLGGTAIHATYYKNMVEDESCKKIMISRDQYARLIEFVKSGFDKDVNGKVIKIQTDVRKSDTDAFYEGTGNYSLFYTCNTWTNNSLKYSGQKACVWTAFQKPIFLKY